MVDGKKANDRSWKTVYAVLKSKTLYMYKDKKMAVDNLEYEEKPMNPRGLLIAYELVDWFSQRPDAV